MQNNKLNSLNHVVALGGGHGLGRVLSSLSFLDQKLTGIVTTTDNGGSSGRLRVETGCIAWGDIRNCLSQLTTRQDLQKALFEFRFDEAGSLSGHSLGNLMLLALDNMCVRPVDALNLIREFLDVTPNILPMTESPANLRASRQDGAQVLGEIAIDALTSLPDHLTISPKVSAPQEAISAIESAELILMGPGSFITSVMPPLLIPEITAAIANSQAPRILIANMVAESGPTGTMKLIEKIRWMQGIIGENVIDAIIWPESREIHGVEKLNVFFADLYDPKHDRLHHQYKLAYTIADVFEKLTQKNSVSPHLKAS